MKDFDTWNGKKKHIERIGHETLSFHEREIWWCSVGLNIGDEEDGKNELFERPVLVIKKFNNRVAWILPMSTNGKEGTYYHKLVHDNREFTIILSQIRLISVKRFLRYIRKISPHQFQTIRGKLIGFLR